MRKNKHLFQIGEVANLFKISRKMILNYEKHGLFKPAVSDPTSGYRYYDSVGISKIALILRLRETGMTVSEIGKYLKGKITAKEQIHKLENQAASIKKSIELLRLRDLTNGDISEVTEVTMPETFCFCHETVCDNVQNSVQEYLKFYEKCFERKLISKDSFLICEFPKDVNADDFYETENIRVKMCVGLLSDSDGYEGLEKRASEQKTILESGESFITFPAVKALSVSYRGDLDKSVMVYAKLKGYLNSHGIKKYGYPREYYLEGEPNEHSIIRIIIPID